MIMTTIGNRLQAVRCRIDTACAAAGRAPGSVQLLAVSKTVDVAALREAIAAGQFAFGENYLQEGVPKIEAIGPAAAATAPGAAPPLVWHCIGPIQSNKTRL